MNMSFGLRLRLQACNEFLEQKIGRRMIRRDFFKKLMKANFIEARETVSTPPSSSLGKGGETAHNFFTKFNLW